MSNPIPRDPIASIAYLLFLDPKVEGTYVCDSTNLSMESSSKWFARSFLLHNTSILLILQPYGTVEVVSGLTRVVPDP